MAQIFFIMRTHQIVRYTATVINGTCNPHRKQVVTDIRDTLLLIPASSEGPTQYRTAKDQETWLSAVFNKYSEMDGVWSAAASVVCVVIYR